MLVQPSSSMPRKLWGDFAEMSASRADWMLPSVLFLNPTGMESPLASSRWVWDSVVRAPMAAQLTTSAMYCGTIGSRNSVAAGSPSDVISRSSSRAIRKPERKSNVSSMRGSLMSPFHPTVVRGFSKYTRMNTHSASPSSRRSAASRRA